MPLHFNYRYLLDHAKKLGNPTTLDYGCGSGEFVQKGIEQGLNIYGADSFEFEFLRKEASSLGDRVREIQSGKLNFEKDFFDLVVSNQVIEHIKDLTGALAEIHRVMKPGALFISLFPTKEVLREVHIGIPLAHRFPKNSRMRYPWTLAMRTVGFGIDTENRSRKQWVSDSLDSIDNGTYYRMRSEIVTEFSKLFDTSFQEREYLSIRLNVAKPFLDFPVTRSFTLWLFRHFVGSVLFARKV